MENVGKLLRNGNRLQLEGNIDKVAVPGLFAQFSSMKDIASIAVIDLTNVSMIDSAGVALLDEMQQRIGKPELTGVSSAVQRSIDTFTSLSLAKQQESVPPGFFEMVGDKAITWWSSVIYSLYLTSDTLYWAFVGIFNHKGQRKNSFIQQSLLIGVDALPIVGLLSFILGLILALQAAAQLRMFGANIFVANLVSISMVREMGPMMTAIIIAGRSGSAIASEIATMNVTEELDALKMMAINPIRYIVVPKFHAMTICMPLLVTVSIFLGVFGGALVAMFYLDLTINAYIEQGISALVFKDIILSLTKSTFFSWVIVIIGSYYGFRVQGGAEGVGKATTASVVASIFAVIVLDVIFSLIYLI